MTSTSERPRRRSGYQISDAPRHRCDVRFHDSVNCEDSGGVIAALPLVVPFAPLDNRRWEHVFVVGGAREEPPRPPGSVDGGHAVPLAAVACLDNVELVCRPLRGEPAPSSPSSPRMTVLPLVLTGDGLRARRSFFARACSAATLPVRSRTSSARPTLCSRTARDGRGVQAPPAVSAPLRVRRRGDGGAASASWAGARLPPRTRFPRRQGPTALLRVCGDLGLLTARGLHLAAAAGSDAAAASVARRLPAVRIHRSRPGHLHPAGVRPDGPYLPRRRRDPVPLAVVPGARRRRRPGPLSP